MRHLELKMKNGVKRGMVLRFCGVSYVVVCCTLWCVVRCGVLYAVVCCTL